MTREAKKVPTIMPRPLQIKISEHYCVVSHIQRAWCRNKFVSAFKSNKLFILKCSKSSKCSSSTVAAVIIFFLKCLSAEGISFRHTTKTNYILLTIKHFFQVVPSLYRVAVVISFLRFFRSNSSCRFLSSGSSEMSPSIYASFSLSFIFNPHSHRMDII